MTNPPLQRRSDGPALAQRARAWLRTTTSGRRPPRATTAPPIPPAGASPPWMPRGPSCPHSLPLLVRQGLWAKLIAFWKFFFSSILNHIFALFLVFNLSIGFCLIAFPSASFERYHSVSIIPSGSTLRLKPPPPPQRWRISKPVCKGILSIVFIMTGHPDSAQESDPTFQFSGSSTVPGPHHPPDALRRLRSGGRGVAFPRQSRLERLF